MKNVRHYTRFSDFGPYPFTRNCTTSSLDLFGTVSVQIKQRHDSRRHGSRQCAISLRNASGISLRNARFHFGTLLGFHLGTRDFTSERFWDFTSERAISLRNASGISPRNARFHFGTLLGFHFGTRDFTSERFWDFTSERAISLRNASGISLRNARFHFGTLLGFHLGTRDFTSERFWDFTSERAISLRNGRMAGRRAMYPRRPRRGASERRRLICSEQFRNKPKQDTIQGNTIQGNMRFHCGTLLDFTSERAISLRNGRMAGRRAMYPRRPRRGASERRRLICSEQFRNKPKQDTIQGNTIQGNMRFHCGTLLDFTSERAISLRNGRMAGRRAMYPRRPRRGASERRRLICSEQFRNKPKQDTIQGNTIQGNMRFHCGTLLDFTSERAISLRNGRMAGRRAMYPRRPRRGASERRRLICSELFWMTRRWGRTRLRRASTPRAEGGAGTSRADTPPRV